MSGATEADREKAAEVLDTCGVRHEFVPTFVAGVAAALAEEREKARAPFREMADHYLSEARKRGLPSGGDLAMIAAAMRRALGDAE